MTEQMFCIWLQKEWKGWISNSLKKHWPASTTTIDRTVHTKYYLSTVQINDYNVIIDGENFFDQPVKKNLRTYNNIPKIATGQGNDYTTSWLCSSLLKKRKNLFYISHNNCQGHMLIT